MEKRITIRELFSNADNLEGKEILVEGWVKTVRDSKTFGFIEINDGSFFKNVQIVFDNNLDNFNDICKLPLSSTICVKGIFVKTEGSKQPFEIKASKIETEFLADLSYPLQKKFHFKPCQFPSSSEGPIRRPL